MESEIKYLKKINEKIKKGMDGLCCEYDEDDKFYNILDEISDMIFDRIVILEHNLVEKSKGTGGKDEHN